MFRRQPIFRMLLLWLPACFAQADAQRTPTAGDEARSNPEVLAATAVPVAVRLGNHALFDVTGGLDGLTLTQRAKAIEGRLAAVADGPPAVLQNLRVIENDRLSEIYAGDALIRTITDQDAVPSGVTRQVLAAAQTQAIRGALQVEFQDRDRAHVLRGALNAALATLILGALLFALRRTYRWIHWRINRAAQGWSWQSSLAKLKLVAPDSVTKASRSVSKGVAWILGIAAVYAYLEYVLSQFPWTRGFGERMGEASKAAIVRVLLGLFDYLPSLINIAVIVIVVVARVILKVVKRLFEQVDAGRFKITNFHPEWAMPTYSLVRFLVIAIATVMVFPYLPGSGSEGFRGVSAFIGLMVSFGAAPAIANLIAGIIITYMRPFRAGDRVKIADATGDILGKDLLVVRMRTIKNVDITIPNALVLANHIINFSSSAKSHGLILNTTVTIGYDAPWKTVHALLLAAAARVEGVLATPPPFVLQTRLDDFYVGYEINAYTDRSNEIAPLYSRLHEAIQDAFNEAGVEILSPHYAAVRDGNRLGLPDDYLPKDYQAPGFTLLSRVLRPRRSE